MGFLAFPELQLCPPHAPGFPWAKENPLVSSPGGGGLLLQNEGLLGVLASSLFLLIFSIGDKMLLIGCIVCKQIEREISDELFLQQNNLFLNTLITFLFR